MGSWMKTGWYSDEKHISKKKKKKINLMKQERGLYSKLIFPQVKQAECLIKPKASPVPFWPLMVSYRSSNGWTVTA